MFSGIRYILGYADEVAPTDAASASDPEVAPMMGTSVLEKTLNAATTKFTEQLLPQQSSIEQLQSSSHQLLPSIKEQHEENKEHEVRTSYAKLAAAQPESAADDEDDAFEADSWELLDLVEKLEDGDEPVDQAQGDVPVQTKTEASPQGVCKSTSGILKSSASVSENSCQQSRQKQKVSFETPDLVRGKQEIEQTKANEALPASLKEAKNDKNKRNSDDWDLDDDEDLDSDFDSMFEPVRKKKSKNQKRQRHIQRQHQQKHKSQKNQKEVVEEPALDENTDSEETLSLEGREIVVETSGSVELISIRQLSMEHSLNTENEDQEALDVATFVAADKELKKRRQPIQVRPIEPERRPGWLLKKQRSKRRPLANSGVENKQDLASGATTKRSKTKAKAASTSSSDRSTPTLMDRISSSIVANLTNLTNGLVSSGALNSCAPVGHSSSLVEGSEKMQQNVVARPSLRHHAAIQNDLKHLSRGSMKRQNITAQQANMQRRPDRRLKMFANPNGCSVNRKVHASIH